MKGLVASALASLVLAAAVLQSGCTTVTQGADGREVKTAPDTADPARRAQVRLELAALYFGRGQYPTALDEIKTVLSVRPEMPEAHSLRGLVLASMGEAKAAEESFQRALQLSPQDAGTLHNYAWFLCQQRRYADGDPLFERALAQPQYRDGARTLLAQGVCLARAGRWPQAEKALGRSYELDPANPVTAFNLADVLLRAGELERARFYVRRINSVPEQVTAQSLWLAARIERRLGNVEALQDLGRQLRDRFPQATETFQFDRGRFDE